jgi:hypothetical protein
MYYITYRIEGIEGTHKAGPYSSSELSYQLTDIATYDGVKDISVTVE